MASTQYVRFSLRSTNVASRLRMLHEVKKCALSIQHTKFRKFRLIQNMKPTISVWSDRKYRSFVSCLQEQKPNAQWLGSGLSNRSHRIVPLGTLNVRNFHRRTGRGGGGARGAVFCATQIFWAARENLGKASFQRCLHFI